MYRYNEQQRTSKVETWLRGTNSRLLFDENVMLNLSNICRVNGPEGRMYAL